MKKMFLIILCLVGRIYSQDMKQYASNSLFSDYKAIRLGDAITIIVIESSTASNEAATATGKTSDLGFNASGGVGSSTIPTVDVALGSKNEFSGSGSTKSTGNVSTKISAMIDSVMTTEILE